MTVSRPLALPAIVAVTACTLVGYPAGAPGRPEPPDVPAAARGPADYRRDRPPDAPGVDLDTISDAVPRDEPRSRYGNAPEYEAFGRVYRTLASSEGYQEEGVASWYGEEFRGRRTASGELYDPYGMTAAHRTLPLPCYVEVTNLENGRTVVVRVNDRGPFHEDRIIDLSYAAAHRLGMLSKGTARVRVRALQPPGG